MTLASVIASRPHCLWILTSNSTMKMMIHYKMFLSTEGYLGTSCTWPLLDPTTPLRLTSCTLKASPGQGIFLPANSDTKLSAYVDADWGSCCVTRKSTTGFCLYLGSSLVCWKSQKQPTVARSSAEVEYRSLAFLMSELLWLQQLLRTFEVKITSIMILSDNKSAIQMATNPTSAARSKHIYIDCHFIRQHVNSGLIKLVYLPTLQQLADIFTKALTHSLFSGFLSKLGILDIFHPTGGGVLQLEVSYLVDCQLNSVRFYLESVMPCNQLYIAKLWCNYVIQSFSLNAKSSFPHFSRCLSLTENGVQKSGGAGCVPRSLSSSG